MLGAFRTRVLEKIKFVHTMAPHSTTGASMIKNQATADTSIIEQPSSPAAETSISTILPASTAMPIHCDSCDEEHNYSMAFLRGLPTLKCKQCGDERQFSSFELVVLEDALKQMGYYIRTA